MSAFPPSPAIRHRSGSFRRKLLGIARNWELYLFLIPTVAYFLIFRYYPMYGIQIAFRNFKSTKGILGSQWVGLRNFERFFSATDFWQLLNNTLSVSIGTLLCSFPVPILLALLLNQLPSKRYKKIVQTVIYAPHFISTVVLVGIISLFFSPSSGIVNFIIQWLGGTPIHFMGQASWFRPLYIGSDIWQNAGWGSILYLAALASISPELHEAAVVDGANKFQRILHVDLPGILPTIVVMFILNSGKVMSVGFEKAYLMQTSLNLSASEIIATYVYKRGLLQAQFSFSTAVGLFESLANLILILTMNFISKKVTDSSLF
ncbi:MAG: sugar ABC transporter permease [Clostridia bacterium]|nr:sugar ABC transporter permease [Clostridia bacterium]